MKDAALPIIISTSVTRASLSNTASSVLIQPLRILHSPNIMVSEANAASFTHLLPDRVEVEKSFTKVNTEHSSAVRFMAYVTGAPPGAKWFRKNTTRYLEKRVTTDRAAKLKKTEYQLRQEVELGWVKKGREEQYLKGYRGTVPYTWRPESVSSTSSVKGPDIRQAPVIPALVHVRQPTVAQQPAGR